MDHPSKYVGEKPPAGGFTGLGGGDGAHEAELRVRAEVGFGLARGGFAEIHVLVPVGDAQRDAGIEFSLGGVDAVSRGWEWAWIAR